MYTMDPSSEDEHIVYHPGVEIRSTPKNRQLKSTSGVLGTKALKADASDAELKLMLGTNRLCPSSLERSKVADMLVIPGWSEKICMLQKFGLPPVSAQI